jgi:hypothetical protein
MPAPSLIAYAETTWTTAATTLTAGAISWLSGDLVVIMSVNEDAVATISVADQFGLTLVNGGRVGTSGVTCEANSWSAVASSNQTSVQLVATASVVRQYGIGIWVWRNHNGIGNRATDITTAKTVSLTRAGANSCVCGVQGDFSAAATTGYSFTPTVANDRQHSNSVQYSFYVADWGDQGGTGSTSYGTSGETSTGTFAKIALEITGLPGSRGAGPGLARGPMSRKFGPGVAFRLPPQQATTVLAGPGPGIMSSPSTAVQRSANW